MAKVSKKKPLGRGLSSLLGENLNVNNLTKIDLKNNLSNVPIDYLSAGSWQVREHFDESELYSLSQSIKNNGIFQYQPSLFAKRSRSIIERLRC